MSSKNNAPDGPSYNELLKLQEGQIAANEGMFNQYLATTKDLASDQKAISDKILDIQLPAMADEAALAQQVRDRYREQGLPYQDEYLAKIQNWDTDQRREQEAARAGADIGQASEAARESEIRRLEQYGIDPSQTRSAALDSKIQVQNAANKAMAANNARKQVETQGLALGGEAMNIYAGMPSTAGAALVNATNSGNAAQGSNAAAGSVMQNAYATGMNNTLAQGNLRNNSYSVSNSIYGNNLQGYNLQNQYGAANQFGQIAGMALGAAMAEGGPVLGIPDPAQQQEQQQKQDEQRQKALLGAMRGTTTIAGYMAEGGPQQQPQKPAAMPRDPSQGIPPDNRPMMLSEGEFVIPDDVARWEGEKSLQKLINKAREDKYATDQQRAQNQRSLGIPA